MSKFDFVILYVEDPAASATFYSDIFGKPVADSMPGFAMLPLLDGLMLGLWQRDDVKPAATVAGGGSEIAVSVADNATLKTLAVEWKAKGIKILQDPTDMGFGRNFTAADPDGHRIRVSVPATR